jgi:uncharacterized protein (DUF1499 family)
MARTVLEPWQKGLVQGRNHILRLAVLVSLLLPVFIAVAAIGTRLGWWSWVTGFGTLTMGVGVAWIMLALVLALFGLYAVLVVRPAGVLSGSAWGMAGVALLVPVAALVYAGSVRATAQSLPPIHDISTDPQNPPQFSRAILDARAGVERVNEVLPPTENRTRFDRANVTPFSGRTFAELQAEAYPQIKPVLLAGVTAEAALERARAAVREAGWTVVADDNASGRIEAVATSAWFGFKDDIVIQVSATSAGSRVDARSVSRVGVSDLGANANRLERFLEAVGG